jgi:hypothetical protein
LLFWEQLREAALLEAFRGCGISIRREFLVNQIRNLWRDLLFLPTNFAEAPFFCMDFHRFPGFLFKKLEHGSAQIVGFFYKLLHHPGRDLVDLNCHADDQRSLIKGNEIARIMSDHIWYN